MGLQHVIHHVHIYAWSGWNFSNVMMQKLLLVPLNYGAAVGITSDASGIKWDGKEVENLKNLGRNLPQHKYCKNIRLLELGFAEIQWRAWWSRQGHFVWLTLCTNNVIILLITTRNLVKNLFPRHTDTLPLPGMTIINSHRWNQGWVSSLSHRVYW